MYNQFLARFQPKTGVLACAGRKHRREHCNFVLNLRSCKDLKRLHLLHLDHDVDLKQTCETWLQTVSSYGSWSGAFSESKIVQLLFGDLTFRCCQPNLRARERCHRIDLPNYFARDGLQIQREEETREIIDLTGTGTPPPPILEKK
jgi:hypothetical protein